MPEAFSSTRSRFQFAAEWLEKLQEHVVLSKGFLVACGTLLLFLCLTVYLVGFKRGESRGREAALAQEDGAAGAGPALKESPLDVRVPRTMQSPGGNSGINQLLGDSDGRREAGAREAAATKAPDAASSDPQKAVPRQHALRLIAYNNNEKNRALAEGLVAFMNGHGIDEAKLVQEEKNGMLSVLVLLANGSEEAAKAMRTRVRALTPPPFDKNYDFKQQDLPRFSYEPRGPVR